ncbi:MAG: hypothetical protein WAM28_00845, partial [Chlamydiales bacterium]
VLISLGATSVSNSYQIGARLSNGVQALQMFDPNQKKGVLRNRAIHTLNEEKSCKAVVLKGYTVDRSTQLDLPSPFSEFLYEKCDTRFYEPKNSTQLCEALNRAKHFDGPIDVLALEGHANNEALMLDLTYNFKAGAQEMECMRNTLASDAQVFLLGCNTATPLKKGGQTLTERVSDTLEGREINGFAAYYSTWSTTTGFSKGRFHHDNHLVSDMYNDDERHFSTVTIITKPVSG